jgi:gas vesicle protein
MRFGSGLIFGAAVGTAISVLLAPQSGNELKAELVDRKEAAKRAGEEAELIETERLRRMFRMAVKNPTALTGQFDAPKLEKTEAEIAAEKLQQERDESAKAIRETRKAEAQVRQAREDADKAREQIAKAEEKAAAARKAQQEQEADLREAYGNAAGKSQQQ